MTSPFDISFIISSIINNLWVTTADQRLLLTRKMFKPSPCEKRYLFVQQWPLIGWWCVSEQNAKTRWVRLFFGLFVIWLCWLGEGRWSLQRLDSIPKDMLYYTLNSLLHDLSSNGKFAIKELSFYWFYIY